MKRSTREVNRPEEPVNRPGEFPSHVAPVLAAGLAWLGNDTVNAVATAAGAVLAFWA